MIQDSRSMISKSEVLFARAFLPATLSLVLFAFTYVLTLDFKPLQALLICESPVVLLVILFERIYPNRPEWNDSGSDVLTDFWHTVTVIPLAIATIPLIGLSGRWVANQLNLNVWPSETPVAIQLILALILYEFVLYWVHRAQHQVPFLWRFHAIHHSTQRLYWLSTYRFHIVDILLKIIPAYGLLFILGISAEVFACFGLVVFTVAYIQHSNIKSEAGILNYVFATPELHRWHHSILEAESSRNFGQTFIAWDLVFGSYYLADSGGQPNTIGLHSPQRFPQSFLSQVAAPFRWSNFEK